LDRRNIFQQHVEEQVVEVQDQPQVAVKQQIPRRDGSRKRNLFKQASNPVPHA
jgi:hypothetical protein